MTTSKPSVIALAGFAGAGKDSFAKLLAEAFAAKNTKTAIVSSGDLIRQYAVDHNVGDPGDRNVLRKIVTDVATTHGFTYWLEESIKSAEHQDASILLYPGLRQTIEVEYLHNRGDIIVGIDVPIENRYEWATKRARPGDEISFERFQANEEAERNGKGQQIGEVMKRLDVTINNNGTFEDLEKLAAHLVADYPDNLKNNYNAKEE